MARVSVLLATYNGERWLDQQLRSIELQTDHQIDIWVSDDGSVDGTSWIINEWAQRWSRGEFIRLSGPRHGATANFRSLMMRSDIDADYVAFCDQDDIWFPEKTTRSIAALLPAGSQPALFGTRTLLVDATDRPTGMSPLFSRPPGFRNALVQNICGGNTMMMNRSGFELLRRAAKLTDFVAHDWFAYLLITAVGGSVTYSAAPLVRYRQHDDNVVGSNIGTAARLQRLGQAMRGRFRAWNDQNLRALSACRTFLTPQAIETMTLFARARHGSIASRLAHLHRSGVYRQTLGGQASLYLAATLAKL